MKRMVDKSWKWVLLMLFAALQTANCRYMDDRLKNESVYDSEDDFDLELALNDYYEDDISDQTFEDDKSNSSSSYSYDYMSDMPADGTEDKNIEKQPGGTSRLNGTWVHTNNTNYLYEDIQKELRASHIDPAMVERSKESRLSQILEQIIRLRNGSDLNVSAPYSSNQETLRKLYEQNSAKVSDSTVFTRFQSFYPSCEVPRNTDEDIWNDGTSMNLLFDLTFPVSSDGSSIVTITSAKLRLFKLSQGGVSGGKGTPDPPTIPSVENKEKPNIPFYLLQASNMSALEDDRRIRVTVYWYTRSLKRNRVKRKLLDSHMLSVSGEEWADFDIRTAVKAWRESGRNFGLLVTVEDEDGNLLPVEQYIYIVNCTKHSSTVRPIPGILMDAAKDYFMDSQQMSNNTNETTTDVEVDNIHNSSEPTPKLSYDSLLYPMIDLCTVEIPTSELNSLSANGNSKISLENHISNMARQNGNVEFFNTRLKNYTFVIVKNENLGEYDQGGLFGHGVKNDTEDRKNLTSLHQQIQRRIESKKNTPELDETQNLAVSFNRKNPRVAYHPNTNSQGRRQNYFQTVPIGSPAVQNPITRMETTTEPAKTTETMQNDSPHEMNNSKHLVRHPRKRLANLHKEIENNLKLTLKEIKIAEKVERQIE